MPILTVESFIDTVFIHQVGELVDSHPYIAFIVMGNGVELLGKCMYADNFDEEGVSRRRFEEAINNLVAFQPYRILVGKNSTFDLYASLRCGLAHTAIPKYPITLSSKNEMSHMLQSINGTRINIKCEDFYEDFCQAWNELKQIEGKVQQNLTKPYLSVPIPRVN